MLAPRDIPVVTEGSSGSDFAVLQAMIRNEPVVVRMEDVGSQWRGWREWREPTTGALQADHFIRCFGALTVSTVAYEGGRSPVGEGKDSIGASTAQYGGEDRVTMTVAEFGARCKWALEGRDGPPDSHSSLLYIKDWHFLRDVSEVCVCACPSVCARRCVAQCTCVLRTPPAWSRKGVTVVEICRSLHSSARHPVCVLLCPQTMGPGAGSDKGCGTCAEGCSCSCTADATPCADCADSSTAPWFAAPSCFRDDWLNWWWDKKSAGLAPAHRDDFRFLYLGVGGTWTPLHHDVLASNRRVCVPRVRRLWVGWSTCIRAACDVERDVLVLVSWLCVLRTPAVATFAAT